MTHECEEDVCLQRMCNSRSSVSLFHNEYSPCVALCSHDPQQETMSALTCMSMHATRGYALMNKTVKYGELLTSFV